MEQESFQKIPSKNSKKTYYGNAKSDEAIQIILEEYNHISTQSDAIRFALEEVSRGIVKGREKKAKGGRELSSNVIKHDPHV